MIYYKETAFLFLLTFAAGRLLMRCWNLDRAGWDLGGLRSKESCLDICFGITGLIFLLYYVAAMLPHPNSQYADLVRFRRLEVILFYMKVDLLAWLLIPAVLARVYLILKRRVAASPLWDGLALAGSVYFAAYLYLGLGSTYYPAPVNLIAVLYLGRFAVLSWGRMRLGRRVAVLALLFVLLVQNVAISALRLFERKNTIHAKAEIARVVSEQYRLGGSDARRILFPFATPYVLMEFGYYLNYRGVPVEGATPESAGPNPVRMVSSAVKGTGPCVGYRSLICQAGGRPEPGDLVIVLPDDNASLAERARYRNGGELLLSYEPRPQLPHWSQPVVTLFRAIWSSSRNEDTSDRRIEASVTAWK
jgi:hypothetical protein